MPLNPNIWINVYDEYIDIAALGWFTMVIAVSDC